MVDCPEEECCELRRGSLNVLESGEDLVFMRVQDPSFRTDMFFSNNQSRRLSPRASCGCRGSHRVLWALKKKLCQYKKALCQYRYSKNDLL